MRTCWTDEVDVDYGEVGHFTGVDALTDLMSQLHDDMGPTYHRLTNFVIAVDGDRATARSYVHAVLMAIPDDPANWVDALGHYDDVFVRTPDGWRIARRDHGHRAGARRRAVGAVVTEGRRRFAAKYGRWAVIAGASEGIGACLADQLAARGLDLVLIARNGALLDEVASAARARPRGRGRALVQDLTDPTSPRRWPKRPRISTSAWSSTTPAPRTGRRHSWTTSSTTRSSRSSSTASARSRWRTTSGRRCASAAAAASCWSRRWPAWPVRRRSRCIRR